MRRTRLGAWMDALFVDARLGWSFQMESGYGTGVRPEERLGGRSIRRIDATSAESAATMPGIVRVTEVAASEGPARGPGPDRDRARAASVLVPVRRRGADLAAGAAPTLVTSRAAARDAPAPRTEVRHPVDPNLDRFRTRVAEKMSTGIIMERVTTEIHRSR